MRLTRRKLVAGAAFLAGCGPADPGPRRRPPGGDPTDPPDPTDGPAGPPNVVFLFPDEWRADVVGAFGHPVVRTPNLDRLIAESVSFAQAYTVSPLCKPARVAMMTQRYPGEVGTTSNVDPVDPSWPTHVRRLRDEAGYHCRLVGKAHLTDGIQEALEDLVAWGFSDAVEVPGDRIAARFDNAYLEALRARGLEETWLRWMEQYEAHAFRVAEWTTRPLSSPGYGLGQDATIDHFVADAAIAFLEDPPAQPFYLQVNFPGPHPPWNAPPIEGYDPADPALPLGRLVPPGQPWSPLVRHALEEYVGPPGEAEARRLTAQYLERVSLVDRQIGRVLDALEAAGRLEDTWVVLASDHGEMLCEKTLLGKVVMFRESTRIPLVVRPPGGLAAPLTTDALVELVDVPATFLAVAGLEPDPEDRGGSLAPLVEGRRVAHRTEVVAQCLGCSAVRTPDALLVHDDEAGVDVEYYDLASDPAELVNRVADPETRAARDALRARLFERLA